MIVCVLMTIALLQPTVRSAFATRVLFETVRARGRRGAEDFVNVIGVDRSGGARGRPALGRLPYYPDFLALVARLTLLHRPSSGLLLPFVGNLSKLTWACGQRFNSNLLGKS